MPIIEGALGPYFTAGAPSNGTDEVQLLTYTAIAGTNVPDSGTFKIVFDGYSTTALAYNASANAVRDALRLLPSIGALGCTVVLAAGPPRTYEITFDGGNMLKRDHNPVTVVSSLLQAAEPVAVVVTTTTPGVNASALGAAVGAVLIRQDTGAQYTNTGTALAPVWSSFATSTTTSSAAELNFNDGPTAGVATASKTAVLGADKELDEFHTAALYLGAAAGTLITATAAEINAKVAAAGQAADGLLSLGVARFTFDPTATAGMRTQAAHDLGVTLPAHAIVVGGFLDVNTVFTSTNGTATVAIHVEGANDIQTATAVSGAPYSTIGRKAIVPKANTPESTSVKTAQARAITATVGTEALLGGKLTGWLYFLQSVASA